MEAATYVGLNGLILVKGFIETVFNDAIHDIWLEVHFSGPPELHPAAFIPSLQVAALEDQICAPPCITL